MKFQIASDLHLETLLRFCDYRVIEPAPDADALILAGDIHAHTRGLTRFSNWPVPVYYVHGNHEPYDACYVTLVHKLAQTARDVGINYLECSTAELPGVRILGTCLWTDYALYGNPAEAMKEAARHMPDHEEIRLSTGKPFLPKHALAQHQKSRDWLQAQLSKPFGGKTIVVTHHAPHPGSVHPRYAGDLLSAAFASDLTPLVEQADLWIHGHVHDSFDYRVGKCRVLANPRGYACNVSYALRPRDLAFGNIAFDPALVLAV